MFFIIVKNIKAFLTDENFAEVYAMSAELLKCQLKGDGTCSSCSIKASDDVIISCGKCKMLFHAVCSSFENEICTRSFFKLWKTSKQNFIWYCNSCLTSLELDAASNDTTRINNLEQQLKSINSTFDEMKELIMLTIPKESSKASNTSGNNDLNNRELPESNTVKSIETDEPNANPWNVQSKVTILKDNLGHLPDLAQLEKNVIHNNLKVKKATHDPNGNVVLICPSAKDAIAVHDQATKDLPHNTVLEPRSASSVINIVGFQTKHELNTLYDLLIKSNIALSSLKGKSLDEIKMFFNMVAVKPCAKNPSVFRAVVRISKTLRHQIRLANNKLKVGFYLCQVYDRILAKRCNNCQTFGHWADQCPITNQVVCAHCSENHATNECEAATYKCTNCAKSNVFDCHHSANSADCPSYKKYRDSLKNETNKNSSTDSNMQSNDGSHYSSFLDLT